MVKKIAKYFGVVFSVIAVCLAMLNINIQPVAAATDMPGYVPIVDMLISWPGSGGTWVTCRLPILRVNNTNGTYNLYDASLGFIGICYVTVDEQAGVIRYGIEPGVETVSTIEVYSSSAYAFAGGSQYYIFQMTQPYTSVSGSVTSSFTYFLNETSSSQFVQSGNFETETRNYSNVLDGEYLRVPFNPVYPSLYSGFYGEFSFAEGVPDFQIEIPYDTYTYSLGDKFFGFKSDLTLTEQIEVTEVYTEFPTDWTSWLADAVGGFFDFEIVPGFSLGVLFITVVGILLFMFFIHVFKG